MLNIEASRSGGLVNSLFVSMTLIHSCKHYRLKKKHILNDANSINVCASGTLAGILQHSLTIATLL